MTLIEETCANCHFRNAAAGPNEPAGFSEPLLKDVRVWRQTELTRESSK